MNDDWIRVATVSPGVRSLLVVRVERPRGPHSGPTTIDVDACGAIFIIDVMTTTDYTDRFALAQAALRLRYERNDNWLADDDVLDIAEQWTTDNMAAWFAEPDVDVELPDYDRLQADLFRWLAEVSR